MLVPGEAGKANTIKGLLQTDKMKYALKMDTNTNWKKKKKNPTRHTK
jgi:hypothetical protein